MITKITVSQTIQVRQYEPLQVTCEFYASNAEECLQATRFTANALKAEYFRQTMSQVSKEDAEKHQAFIAKHLSHDYQFKEDNL